MSEQQRDHDAIIVGGGPAGATLGSLLAMQGFSSLILEKDIHPRDHVGESITPSTNPIFKQIGFLSKVEDANFVRKPGACWTSPRATVGKFVSLRLGEFPPPNAPQLYTYNVERDWFDTMLLRHAHEKGAKVVQGVNVKRVLFEEDRAVGVQVDTCEGWEQELRAPIVVDASGRRCLIANQLKLKRKDPLFNQFAIYSWFRGVEPNPPGFEGFLFLHFLDLERSWAWQIPMRNGVTSVGVVMDKQDFQKSGKSGEDFFESLMKLNRTLTYNMRDAERIRPWWIEADYSYVIDQLVGPGWMLIGDAVRFVDPVFSSGVDIACYSALYASEAIAAVLRGEKDEELALKEYESRVGDGVEAWYDLIRLFYQLRNLFTAFAIKQRFREKVVRILQGNLYQPETLERARELIDIMEGSYRTVMSNEGNLLRPGAMMQSTAAPAEVAAGNLRSEPSIGSTATPVAPRREDAFTELAGRIVSAARGRSRVKVGGAVYVVEEVTWPVSPNEDGSSSFACPHTAWTLVRDRAVLLDVRKDYWDGRISYRVVGERLGRWMRFRIGSPGNRGWDLHLATDEERQAFAQDATEVAEALASGS